MEKWNGAFLLICFLLLLVLQPLYESENAKEDPASEEVCIGGGVQGLE